MGASFNPLSGSITRAAFEAELATARTWVNGGALLGDIVDGSIQRTHIYRPDTQAFPLRNTECQTQAAYDRGRAREALATRPGGVAANGRLWLARLRERRSIFTRHLLDGETWPIADGAARFHLDTTSVVEWSANWEAIAQSQVYGSETYPDDAGSFRLRYQEVDAAAPSTVSGSRRRLNSGYLQVGASPIHARLNVFSAGGSATLTAGTYDTWLEYSLDSTDTTEFTGIEQIILGVISIVVEIHRQ